MAGELTARAHDPHRCTGGRLCGQGGPAVGRLAAGQDRGPRSVVDAGRCWAPPRTAFGQHSDSAPRHGGTTPAAPGDAMITVHVPAMTARQDVRTISAVVSDVPGVQTLRADLA